MFWMISYMCIAAQCVAPPPTRFFLQETTCNEALTATKPPAGVKGVCVSVPEIVIGQSVVTGTGVISLR